ncbi:MAG: DUF1702 family protein [Actinophytocola sp.]|nr:DUF1702 family protein [Actinophytocola sp.]
MPAQVLEPARAPVPVQAPPQALTALVRASGEHGPCFGQGAVFAIAARARSGNVETHTEQASRHLFGEDPYQVGEWTDIAAEG